MKRLFNIISRYSQRKKSSLAFWWLPLYEGHGVYDLSIQKATDYYLDFSSKADYNVLFDENQVVMLDYMGSIGKQYNPCAIAQYGLGLLSRYLKSKDASLLNRAIIQGDWICRNMVISEKQIGRLEYTFSDFNYEGSHNNISSIVQGQAISFLLRLYVITKNDEYLKCSDYLFRSFEYTTQEGGVVKYDAQGRMYLEEAITEKISCVLDGFIYAIFGVYDYYLITSDMAAKHIFEQCCITVSERLDDFDLGFWSRADCYIEKPKMPASSFYHNVHVQQLKALFILTGVQKFYDYAMKWQTYQNNFLYRKIAFLYKCWFKVFYY